MTDSRYRSGLELSPRLAKDFFVTLSFPLLREMNVNDRRKSKDKKTHCAVDLIGRISQMANDPDLLPNRNCVR